MAKYCYVCQLSFAEDRRTCPHCRTLIEIVLPGTPAPDPESAEAIRPQLGPQLPGSCSEADLDLPADVTARGSSPALPPPLAPQTASGSESVLDIDLPARAPALTSGSGSPAGQPDSDSGSSSLEWASLVDLNDSDRVGVVPLEDLAPAVPAETGAAPLGFDLFAESRTAQEPPARAGGQLLGAGVLGALLGSVASLGLWICGVEPPAAWRLTRVEAAPVETPLLPRPVPSQEAPTLEAALLHLQNGDVDKALPILEGIGDEPNPNHLAARGEARWLSYLKQHKTTAALKPDDDRVQQAVADLTAANNAAGWFWLGQIREQTGDRTGARQLYHDGLERFAADPVQRQRFQGAVDRLEGTAVEQPVASHSEPAPRSPTRGHELARLLTALQGQPAAAAATEPEEAGFAFWAACKLAQQQDYAGAVVALQKAQTAHDQRRLPQLRKVQNPASDPAEEIFLKCCAELLAYWRLRESLRGAGILTSQQPDAVAAVQRLLADGNQVRVALQVAQKEREAAVKRTAQVETACQTAEAQAKALTDQLQLRDAQLKAVGSRLEAAGVARADLLKSLELLITAKSELEASLQEATRKLQAAPLVSGEKSLPPTTHPAPLINPLDPFRAAQRYAAGLQSYYQRRYGEAEQQFVEAQQHYGQDARYLYFLGLARLAQGKHAVAYEAFQSAAELERHNRPARTLVSTALERIQGAARQVVNQFRP